eukprot:105435-Rhodomonas_salina.2
MYESWYDCYPSSATASQKESRVEFALSFALSISSRATWYHNIHRQHSTRQGIGGHMQIAEARTSNAAAFRSW